MYEYVKAWRKKVSKSIIDGFGGKCNRCGYNQCLSALDCHHINPEDKLYTISNLLRNPVNLDTIYNECEKCILLCKNCHSELHEKLWKIEDINLVKFNRPIANVKVKSACGICGTMFFKHVSKYCSKECADISRRKVKIRPCKEKLQHEVDIDGFVKVGKKYGVSDNTIRKWLKS